MRPLRVAVVSSNLNVGGAERVLAQIVCGLRARGLDARVCCLYEAGPVGEELRRAGVPVADRFFSSKRDVRGFTKLVRWLRATEPDVFYFNNQPLTQAWGSLAARLARVPVQATAFHFTFREPEKDRLGRALNRVLGRWVDVCIALSEGQKEYLVERESMRRETIVVVPNGIEAERFDVTEAVARAKRRELGVPEDGIVVGMVAQLRPEKNHAMLLRAAERVAAVRDDVFFVAVGGGDAQGELERLAGHMGLAERVKFVGIRNDVPAIVAACDVGVLCSFNRVETFPLSLLELMAAAKPVVSTDVGSVREIVVPGETGFIVPVDDDRALADRLLELATEARLRERMGEAGRGRVRERFTVDSMVERTQSALEAAVARSARRD